MTAVFSHADILSEIVKVLQVTKEEGDAPLRLEPSFQPKKEILLDIMDRLQTDKDRIDIISNTPQQYHIKFGSFVNERFFQIIPQSAGDKLFRYFSSGCEIKEYTKDVAKKGHFRINGEAFETLERPDQQQDLKDYNVVAQAIRFRPITTFPDDFTTQRIVEKICSIPDVDNLKLIIQQVTEGRVTYRVYFEKINPKEKCTNLERGILFVVARLQGVSDKLVITSHDKAILSSNFNAYFGRDAFRVSRGTFYSKFMNKPRMVSMEQLLLGNWSVMLKYDGQRRLLFAQSTPASQEGLYVVSSPFDVQKLEGIGGNFVLDGEWFDRDKKFRGFDVVVADGIDVRKSPFETRSFMLSKIEESYPDVCQHNPVRTSHVKTEEGAISISQMDSVIAQIQGLKSSTTVETDGLVFISPLGYSSEKYKWKPNAQLTIDVVVKEGMAYIGDEESQRKFVGSAAFPSPDGVTVVVDKVPFSSNVIECTYKNGALRTYRTRSDKKYPNADIVAMQIWDELHEPTTMDDLLGFNLRYMSRAVELDILSRLAFNLYSVEKGAVREGVKVFVWGRPTARWLQEIRNLGFTVTSGDTLPSETVSVVIAMFPTLNNKAGKSKELDATFDQINNCLDKHLGTLICVYLDYDEIKAARNPIINIPNTGRAMPRFRLKRKNAFHPDESAKTTGVKIDIQEMYSYDDKTWLYDPIVARLKEEGVDTEVPVRVLETSLLSSKTLSTMCDVNSMSVTTRTTVRRAIADAKFDASIFAITPTGGDKIALPEDQSEAAKYFAITVAGRV